jgi:hypothetical protein
MIALAIRIIRLPPASRAGEYFYSDPGGVSRYARLPPATLSHGYAVNP